MYSIFYFLIWAFLLVFPKGGFKIGDIPITWGYLLLGIATLSWCLKKHWIIHTPRMILFLCTVPFQCIGIATYLLNGTEDLGLALSLWISFCFLPFSLFVIFSHEIETLHLSTLLNRSKNALLLLASYGIFLFLYKMLTGQFIEIPLLTTNLGDWGTLEDKCINRGFLFKLISTYNNGNVFGVCILILLPLYSVIESSKWRQGLVKLALLLTLSRAVWIGLIFSEMTCATWMYYNNQISRYKFFIRIAASLGAIASFLLVFALYFDIPYDFFVDPSLGGRSNYFAYLSDATLFASKPLQNIAEATYLGILNSLGISGLFAFLLAMTAPIYIGIFKPHRTHIQSGILLGLVNYLFVAIAEGALVNIPTLCFYWFMASLLASRTPDALMS